MTTYMADMRMALCVVNDSVRVTISDVSPMLSANANTSHSSHVFKEWNFNNLKRTYHGRKKETTIAKTKLRVLLNLKILNTNSMSDMVKKV